MPSVESYIALHSTALGLRFSKTHLLTQACVKETPVFSLHTFMNWFWVKLLSVRYACNFIVINIPFCYCNNPIRNYTRILNQMKIVTRSKNEKQSI